MADSQLDHVVKGNPTPAITSLAAPDRAPQLNHQPSDPIADTPSSPSQIYLNLLIVEASLRSQYLALAARRRQHTSVAIWLTIWIASFFWLQFLRPREDGSGVGGSPYWLVDMCQMVALISGLTMAVLFHLTGQWDRGIRWPRRWFVTANRGLRTMNCKIVLVSEPWWRTFISRVLTLLPIALLLPGPGSSFRRVDILHSDKRHHSHGGRLLASGREGARSESIEENVAPGGDYIKILLLPKHFTPEFREDWEVYRQEYWEHENQRRAELKKRLRKREREIAKEEGRWFWWLRPARAIARQAPPQLHSHVHHQQPVTRKHTRRSSNLRERDGSHSRSSSRSSSSQPADAAERERRWSTSTSGSVGGGRRLKASGTDASRTGSISRASMKMTAAATTTRTGSRPGTPNVALRSQSGLSSVSNSTEAGDGSGAKEGVE